MAQVGPVGDKIGSPRLALTQVSLMVSSGRISIILAFMTANQSLD